jgi:hypothetical protein
LHRFGARRKENAVVTLARARSPGSGRNNRMCAAQKAGFAVTDGKNANPTWRAAYWSPPLGVPGAVSGPGGGWLQADSWLPSVGTRRRVDAALAEDLVIRPGHDMAGEGNPERAVGLGTISGACPQTCAM